jgi:alkaline phosphatase D
MMNKFALAFSALALATSCSHFTTSNPAASSTAPADPVGPAAAPTPVKAEVRNTDDSLHPRGIDFGATIKAVAFGSSANQDAAQPLWKTIASNNPDLFLFMGDNIQTSKPGQKSLMAQYRKLDRVPEYRSFREKVPFMATWDDQDYGSKEFLHYWSYVANSTSFGQKGIYHGKIIGPKKKQVQIVMLDTRTFRTKADGAKATLLGEPQWSWLEAELKRPVQVRIIVTSIPLIASEHGTDKWSNYPVERQRFFDLLKKTGARNVVVFSGDRHQSSIAKTGVKDWGMLFDITASPINEPPAAAEDDPAFEGKPYAGESFGYAQIDWHDKRMSLQIRDTNNKVLNSVSFKIR